MDMDKGKADLHVRKYHVKEGQISGEDRTKNETNTREEENLSPSDSEVVDELPRIQEDKSEGKENVVNTHFYDDSPRLLHLKTCGAPISTRTVKASDLDSSKNENANVVEGQMYDETGTIFDQLGMTYDSGEYLTRPQPGDQISVYQCVLASYSGKKDQVYNSGEFVYLLPKKTSEPLQIAKILHFQERSNSSTKSEHGVLVERYLRASNSIFKDMKVPAKRNGETFSTESILGEVFQTGWKIYLHVSNIVGHATILQSEEYWNKAQGNTSANDAHLCRCHFDITSHTLSILPNQIECSLDSDHEETEEELLNALQRNASGNENRHEKDNTLETERSCGQALLQSIANSVVDDQLQGIKDQFKSAAHMLLHNFAYGSQISMLQKLFSDKESTPKSLLCDFLTLLDVLKESTQLSLLYNKGLKEIHETVQAMVQRLPQLEISALVEVANAFTGVIKEGDPSPPAIDTNGIEGEYDNESLPAKGNPIAPYPILPTGISPGALAMEVDEDLKKVGKPFPLNLTTSLKSRWSQERYHFAQQALFAVLIHRQALDQDRAVRRSLLRDDIRSAGIGDLGLIDHVIKALSGELVIHSGYHIKKQHNDKGILEYWLSSVSDAVPPDPEDILNMNLKELPKKPRKTFTPIDVKVLEEVKLEVVKPCAILTHLKEIRTMLASFQDEFGRAQKKRKYTDPSNNDDDAVSEKWTFKMVMQHVEEEMEKTVEKHKKDFLSMVNDNDNCWTNFKAAYDGKLQSCFAREAQLMRDLEHLKREISSKLSKKSFEDTPETSKYDRIENLLQKELSSFKDEIAAIKSQVFQGSRVHEVCTTFTNLLFVQHELFLIEGGSRLDELTRQNMELQNTVESLKQSYMAKESASKAGRIHIC